MTDRIFHGGGLDNAVARYGGTKAGWLDLSTGINPHSYPVDIHSPYSYSRLPDQGAKTELETVARKAYLIPPGYGLVMANGTQRLIETLPSALKASRVAIIGPTYGEYAHVWRKAGGTVFEVAAINAVPDEADCVVVVNPDNPSARIYSRSELLNLAEALKARNCWLVVDEAFADPLEGASLVPDLEDNLTENIIVLRSFGKFFGLAGLRLGFFIARPSLLRKMEDLIGLWPVSGAALEIGARALGDAGWIAEMRSALDGLSTQLAELLKANGFRIEGINPLFVCASHPHATAIEKQLAQRHILVRPFTERPEFLRFGLCKNDEELKRLDTALQSVLESNRIGKPDE